MALEPSTKGALGVGTAGAVVGGLVGAGLGVALSGQTAEGAAIGGAVGAAGGGLLFGFAGWLGGQAAEEIGEAAGALGIDDPFTPDDVERSDEREAFGPEGELDAETGERPFFTGDEPIIEQIIDPFDIWF